MLLGKLKLNITKKEVSGGYWGDNQFDRERGRFYSKDLARQMTEHYSEQMIAFYPSVVNIYSLELIVEMIGNHYLRGITNRFDFEEYAKEFQDYIKTIFPYDFTVEFTEETFCSASAVMIYCYKQDDYLIPDSDPHDVMSSENKYNQAGFTYSGRFLPMIKLWCDLIMNSNRLFTADILDINAEYPIRKQLEYEAFSKPYVEKELQVLQNSTIGFRPFNKYYQLLVSDRTMIPISIGPLVEQLYNNHQLCSKAIYVIDIVDYMKCCEQDQSFGMKLEGVLKELRGSTLVVYIDVPNHFLVNKEKHVVETDAYQKELMNNREIESTLDNEFLNAMQEYNLLDSDDSLDWHVKPYLIRELVNNLDKATDKEDQRTHHVEEINRIIYSMLRSMNVIFVYTDTIAYKQNYIFEKFSVLTDTLSISKVYLSDPALADPQLQTFGESIGLAHFGINSILKNKAMSEYVIDCVKKLIEEKPLTAADTTLGYASLYGFRHLVHSAFDYHFKPDVEGNEYFKAFKKKRAKKLDEAKTKKGEDKEEIQKKFGMSNYGINASAAIRADDNNGLGFFNDVNYRRNQYSDKKEALIALEKMIGLTQIKDQIKQFAAFVELNKVKADKDLKPIPISKHMIFMGNPGTAKTTVALQLAKILHEKGLIPTNEIKHVSRDDLVGKYVGWTARLVKEAIESAKGGILFVDEAYSLSAGEGGTNSYGQEAINTFVNYMDKADIRDSTIIIFAGYRDEMKDFVDSNPGLKSRVGFYFDFPDYTTDELIEIAKIQADSNQYILEQEYLDKLREEIDKCRGAKDFGNGRFVRNIFEKSVLQQSQRLINMGEDKVKHGNFTKEQLITITGKDFSTKGIDVSSSKKHVGFRTSDEIK